MTTGYYTTDREKKMHPPGNIKVSGDTSNDTDRFSPTLFSGAETPTGNSAFSGQPMFPDMRRDDFMSKSSTSTKETAAVSGDSWSISAASDEQYRIQQQPRNRGGYEIPGRHNGRKVQQQSANQTYNDNHEISTARNRTSRAPEWRQERQDRSLSPKREVRSKSRGHVKSRPRERMEYVEDQYSRQTRENYGDKLDDEYQRRETKERVENYRRPQHHQFETEEYYSLPSPREDRGAPRSIHVHNQDQMYPLQESPLRFSTLKSRIEENKRLSSETIDPETGIRDGYYRNKRNRVYPQETEQGYRNQDKFTPSSPYSGSYASDPLPNIRHTAKDDRYRKNNEDRRWFHNDDDYRTANSDSGRERGRHDQSSKRSYQSEGNEVKREFDERGHGRKVSTPSEETYQRRGRSHDQRFEPEWRDDHYSQDIEQRERNRRLVDDIVEEISMPSPNADLFESRIKERYSSHSQGRSRSRRREGSIERNPSIDNRIRQRDRSIKRNHSIENRGRGESIERNCSTESRRRDDSIERNPSIHNRGQQRDRSIERNYSSDNRRRGGSIERNRSIESRSTRRREASKEGYHSPGKKKNGKTKSTQPTEFVIDIPRSSVDNGSVGHGVKISPSGDDSKKISVGSSILDKYNESLLENENYSKRLADANLMREQSQARHQILREIKQAMEMKDLAKDRATQKFWGRQVKTLNASLQRLWDIENPEEDVDDLTGEIEDKRGTRITNNQENRTSSNIDSNVVRASIIEPITQPPVNNFTTVKVQAPDDLPAGHQFTIRVNGKLMKAEVPNGGVHQGDVFMIRIPLSSPPTTPTPTKAESKSTVKVRSPATMPEGYRFTAKMGDRTIVATVPRGGVQKGEVFVVHVEDQKLL